MKTLRLMLCLSGGFFLAMPVFATGMLPYNNFGTVYPTTLAPLDVILARGDIDSDGVEDVIIGGLQGTTRSGIRVMRNNGNFQFTDITSRLTGLPWPLEFYNASVTIADFNHDGLNDIVFFDRGTSARALDGAYVGEEPVAFYSSVNSQNLTYSDAFAVAIKNYRLFYNSATTCGLQSMYYSRPNCDVWTVGDGLLPTLSNRAVHSKFQSAADVDQDSDVDLFAEGGGAFGGQAYGLMFVNQGSGTFVVKTDRVDFPIMHGGSQSNPGSWRHYRNHFADMNGDGYPDLILGKLANINSPVNPDHDTLFSKILINNGQGFYHSADMIELPNPQGFETGPMEQATAVPAIATADMDGDGLTDLFLAHTRGSDGMNLGNTLWTATGRFIQYFHQTTPGVYKDETDTFIGDQAPYTVVNLPDGFSHDPNLSQYFERNYNVPWGLRILDIDGDGVLDLATEQVQGNLHADFSPAFYLWNGSKLEPYSTAALQAPEYFYYHGQGLAFIEAGNSSRPEMLWAGAVSGAPGMPLNGLYLFNQ